MSHSTNGPARVQGKALVAGCRFRGCAARVVLLAGGIAVGMTIIEFLLRVLGLGYDNTHMESSPVLQHIDSKNHGFISYHPSQEYGGHLVYYDDQGLRALPKVPTEDKPEFVVAFLGDSFVEAL